MMCILIQTEVTDMLNKVQNDNITSMSKQYKNRIMQVTFICKAQCNDKMYITLFQTIIIVLLKKLIIDLSKIN